MLDLTDFGPNPHVPSYQDYGAMTVRWAKGTTGSGPRRRTVLTVPEFPWVVELLHYWCTEGRQMFSTADRSPALWPSERGGRLTINALGRSFTVLRRRAGLPKELKLHVCGAPTPRIFSRRLRPVVRPAATRALLRLHDSLYTSVSSDFKQRAVQQMIARRIRMEDSDG